MKLKLQIILRYLKAQNRTFKVTTLLSGLGVILGVSCLVLTMAVVSGVQRFIQKSVTDLTGDMIILYTGGRLNPQDLSQRLHDISPEFVALTPFISSQGIIVNKSEILGVVLHGIEPQSAGQVLHLKSRLVEGHMNLKEEDDVASVVVGKEIAKKLKLKIDDVFRVVIPRPSAEKIQSFSPIVQKMKLVGIADFGKYDYNEKVIITTDTTVQKLLKIDRQYVGAYAKFKDTSKVPLFSEEISEKLGIDYKVRDWRELNSNFFSAVELEKVVIFIVVLFIVIVASFNVSSTIFVSVLRKFADISILKTLGATSKFLVRLFVLQGLIMGVLSSLLGIGLGVVLALILKYTRLIYVPGDIYKFDHLPVEIRWTDLTVIFFVTVFICYLSSILPARRGAKLKPIEGLKYE
jgi:lipoprotein-releasing system permease protein